MDHTIISPSVKPVVRVLANMETEFVSPDPSVAPISALVSNTPERCVMIRYTPTPTQRRAIAEGCDIYLSVLTYGHTLHPIMLFTSGELDEAQVVEVMQLNPGV